MLIRLTNLTIRSGLIRISNLHTRKEKVAMGDKSPRNKEKRKKKQENNKKKPVVPSSTIKSLDKK